MCKNNYLNTCPVNVNLFWNCVLDLILKKLYSISGKKKYNCYVLPTVLPYD